MSFNNKLSFLNSGRKVYSMNPLFGALLKNAIILVAIKFPDMHPIRQVQFIVKKMKSTIAGLLLCICVFLNSSCHDNTRIIASKFMAIKPIYSNIQLTPMDTLHFQLDEDAYNSIKSFNYFISKNGKQYISFYDRRSETVSIYDFNRQVLVKKLQLQDAIKTKRFYKTSVFIHDYDSIYVTNLDKLYLIDSSGKLKRNTTFNSMESIAYFETPLPIVIKENTTYMGVRPFVDEKSLSALREWKVLCAFDFEKDICNLYYPLPAVYRKGLYGKRFLDYSYCYNNKGNFVFSFPADSNIYETDLRSYHIAYNGKSKFQTGSIDPVSKQALENDEGGKEYTLRDSYGPIYFDPYNKRYLRIAKQKVSKEALASKTTQRKTTIIVFDQQFKIIGEFEFSNDYLLDTIFFTANGSMYVRVNKDDETALHFVQLHWENVPNESSHLTKK